MTLTRKYKIFLAVITCGCASLAAAEEKPVSLDWSNLKIQLSGYSGPVSGNQNLKDVEQLAWQDGYRRVADYLKANKLVAEDQTDLQQLARKSTHSTNTIYYGDGSIRVEMEALLSESYPTAGLGLSDATASAESTNSALVLKLTSAKIPAATFQVLSSSGQVLYSSKDVTKQAFAKNLMGRWVTAKNFSKLSSFTGTNPVEVSVDAGGQNLVVDSEAWNKALNGNRGLLEQAKVVLVNP